MEAQAIHWNPRYETLEKCYENSDGMAIISYLFLVNFDVGETNIYSIQKFILQNSKGLTHCQAIYILILYKKYSRN